MPGLSWGCRGEAATPPRVCTPITKPTHKMAKSGGFHTGQQWCILAQDNGFPPVTQSSQWSLNSWKHLEKLALNRCFSSTRLLGLCKLHVSWLKPGPTAAHAALWACVCAKSLPSYPTLCDPLDYGLPGSSVHGILQARIPEWVVMPSSRGSSQLRD